MTQPGLRRALLALVAVALSGCSETLDTSYGHIRGKSINGTGALADMFRARGCEVRTALRRTDELSEWADVIVRFAPYPGPPSRDEARWYSRWLDDNPDRALIYVPRDYDATKEYWSNVLENLPANTSENLRKQIKRERDRPERWLELTPKRPKDVADATDWFAVNPATTPPAPCKTLDGPWAQGIDAKKAAVIVHETLKVDAETVLLGCGPKQAIAMDWTRYNDSRVLVIANASFLLNAALLNAARRPLAEKVVEWAAEEPLHIAFAESAFGEDEEAASPSIFSIFERVMSIRWVMIQMLVLGLAACLWRAPRLGRARSEPPSDADRPAAHAEALGALMARLRKTSDARAILDAYRRWRYPSRFGTQPAAPSGRSASAFKKRSTANPESRENPEIEFLDQ